MYFYIEIKMYTQSSKENMAEKSYSDSTRKSLTQI